MRFALIILIILIILIDRIVSLWMNPLTELDCKDHFLNTFVSSFNEHCEIDSYIFALILSKLDCCWMVCFFRKFQIAILVLSPEEKCHRILQLGRLIRIVLVSSRIKAKMKSKRQHIFFGRLIIEIFVFVNVEKLEYLFVAADLLCLLLAFTANMKPCAITVVIAKFVTLFFFLIQQSAFTFVETLTLFLGFSFCAASFRIRV